MFLTFLDYTYEGIYCILKTDAAGIVFCDKVSVYSTAEKLPAISDMWLIT